MVIFDGKKFALEKEEKLKEKIALLNESISFRRPKMASILIGDNPESRLYLKLKEKAALRIGAGFELIRFSEECQIDRVIEKIEELNQDPEIGGIMVQLPLPKRFKAENQQLVILSAIAPQKDIDCLTPENLGLLFMGRPRFLPATVKAVLEIIYFSFFKKKATDGEALMGNRWLSGKSVCVVGASEIVGKPLAILLSEIGATVTLCRSTTKNLSEFTQKADILVSATGVPGLIKKEMVKKGAVVVDVGIKKVKTQENKPEILGDVDRGVLEVVSFFTPVPGGVGPVTITCLLENLLLSLGE